MAYPESVEDHLFGLARCLSPRAINKLALRTATDIHETIVMAPPLNAALATRWLHDDSFAALVHEIRTEADFRQRLVAG